MKYPQMNPLDSEILFYSLTAILLLSHKQLQYVVSQENPPALMNVVVQRDNIILDQLVQIVMRLVPLVITTLQAIVLDVQVDTVGTDMPAQFVVINTLTLVPLQQLIKRV